MEKEEKEEVEVVKHSNSSYKGKVEIKESLKFQYTYTPCVLDFSVKFFNHLI